MWGVTGGAQDMSQERLACEKNFFKCTVDNKIPKIVLEAITLLLFKSYPSFNDVTGKGCRSNVYISHTI